jgi:hypothetical protein
MTTQRALISRYTPYSMFLFTAVYIYGITSIKRETLARVAAAVVAVALLSFWYTEFTQMQLSRKLYWQRKYRLTNVAVYATDGVISGLNLEKNTDEDHARAASILDEAKRLGIYNPQVAVDALKPN